MRSCTFLAVIAAAAALAGVANAQIFVDRDAPDGGNGASWATAFNTIQEAINVAQFQSQIWVAAGDYPEVDTNGGASLDMKPNTSVFGGFAGTETSFSQRDFTANVTRIVGTKASVGDNVATQPVVAGDTNAVLDGFTITGGRAANGAGMLNEGKAPIVRNCIFIDNKALIVGADGGIGGGMLNFDDATPVVEDCTFIDNVAELSGGGMQNVVRSNGVFTRCRFINNRARLGAGVASERSNGVYDSCVFQGNSAERLRPVDAAALVAGGGFYNVGHLPSQLPDAVPADPLFTNCLFAQNTASDGNGGAMFLSETLGRFINCTIAGNTAANVGGIFTYDGARATVTNSIVWGNGTGQIFDSPDFFFEGAPPSPLPPVAFTTVSSTDVQGGWPGTGNLNVDPLFGEDFRLSNTSPLIDAGVATAATTDFEGDARGFDGSGVPRGDGSNYDIGYDEFAGGIVDPVEGEGDGGTEPGIVYVNLNNASGTQDGQSWATAFRTIQAGIDAAAGQPDAEVWVAAGIYAEARANNGSVVMAAGVDLYGGFAGNETLRTQRNIVANLTIINGGTSNAGSPATSVVVGANNARLDGFAIVGGNGTRGAGLLNIGVSPTVSGCTFTSNTASERGGAVFNSAGASPVFENCVFRLNQAGTDGGAIATEGATATLRNVVLRDNSSQGNGGAVYNGLNSSLLMEAGLVRDNAALGEGGGIYNAENSTARITRVRIHSNSTEARGGGISNHAGSTVFIGATLIAKNEAAVHGGGINNSAASPTIVGTTITQNTATFRGAGIFNNATGGTSQTTASGVIIWGNTGENVGNGGTGRLLANYSDIQGGISGGTGNIDADPLFVDPAANNFKLQPGSPAIDSGQNTSGSNLGAIIRDFELDFRGFDGNGLGGGTGDGSDYDMGYDEFTGAANTGYEPEGEFEGQPDGEGAADGEGAVEGEGAPEGVVEGEGAPEGEGEGTPGPGDIVFVNKANTSPVQDGSSWATAFTELRTAIETAGLEGASEIWVARGVYDETRTSGGTLLLRGGISLYGGFAGGETDRAQRNIAANITVIDGSRANAGQPAQRVLQGADGARLDGFTVTGGRGASGAGMLNFESSPVIANCTFVNNEATDFGGAIFNLGDATPFILNCTFSNNSAGESGGGIVSLSSSPVIRDCLFVDNRSRFGGAIFNNISGGEIRRCTFNANEATGSAGAIALLESSPTIAGCLFTDNTALENAGAVFVNIGSARVEDCRFFRNTTQGSGGALYTLGPGDEQPGETSPFVVNSIFFDNRAVNLGGAIFNNVSSPRIVNCTIYGNQAVDNGGGIGNFEARPNIVNTIVWGNTGTAAISEITSLATVSYSIVQGGFPGTGNLSGDPGLVNPTARDFRLIPSSPAIDAGRDTSSAAFGNVEDDIFGNPRGIDSAAGTRGDGSDYDIGAHEFGGPASEGETEAEGEEEGAQEGAVEGGFDGEEEGEGPGCTLTSVQLLSPANNAIIVSGNSAVALPLGLAARTNCAADTGAVQFRLDGTVIGGTDSPPYALLIEDINAIGAGPHTAGARAFRRGGGATVETTHDFTLVGAPAGADPNRNGFPDIPGAVLLQDGDIWTSSTTTPGTNQQRTGVVQRFDTLPGNAGGPVSVVLSHPRFPEVQITLRISRRVLPPNAIGILVAGVAPDFATLFGPDEATQLSRLPEGGVVEGAPIFAAGILVSEDNGQTFTKLDPQELVDNPARITYQGLSFSPENADLEQHPVNVISGGNQGLRIEAVFQGGWGDGNVQNIAITTDRLDATLTALGLMAPFNARPDTSAISVTPAQFTFGRVEVGETRETVFVVTNTGSGLVSGQASVAGPFTIVDGAGYTLSPGQSQNVRIAFTPGDTRAYTEVIHFSGGNGVDRTVTGTGIPNKPLNLLGCAPAPGGTGGRGGDLLIVLLAGVLLFAARRQPARF